MTASRHETGRRPAQTLTRPSPQAALNQYLATLLEEGTQPSAPTASEPEAVPALQPEVEAAAVPPSEPEPVSEPDPLPGPEVSAPPEVEVQAPEQAASTPDLVRAWQENGRPEWAQAPFECLLFRVDGLALAVPMVLLGTIYPLDRELTPLFGQPDWFFGLYPVSGRSSVRVVETARLVMPEKYRAAARAGLHYAIGLHGSDWALAAHAVEGSVTLAPEDVKWRQGRSQRPWLAGTVVERMCALLDPDALVNTLLRDQSRAAAAAQGNQD